MQDAIRILIIKNAQIAEKKTFLPKYAKKRKLVYRLMDKCKDYFFVGRMKLG